MNKKLFVVNSFWLPTECFEEFGSRASKVNHDMDDMIVTTKLFTSLFSEVYINMNKLKFDTIKYLSFFNCGNLTLHDISVITKHCNLISVRLIYVKIYRNSSVDAPPATIEDVVTGFGDVKIFHLK
uniref:Uncharacterized protein n=1 Tax=Panagrolaimus davidi TaxID=227884 RepID=A0A914QS49_9BILA